MTNKYNKHLGFILQIESNYLQPVKPDFYGLYSLDQWLNTDMSLDLLHKEISVTDISQSRGVGSISVQRTIYR